MIQQKINQQEDLSEISNIVSAQVLDYYLRQHKERNFLNYQMVCKYLNKLLEMFNKEFHFNDCELSETCRDSTTLSIPQ